MIQYLSVQYWANYFAKRKAKKVPIDKLGDSMEILIKVFPSLGKKFDINNIETEEDLIATYAYGYNFHIEALLKGILLLLLALIIGVTTPATIIAITFASCRVSYGGYHMKTYSRCITLSLTLFLGVAYLAQNTYQYLTNQVLWYLINIAVLLGIYIIYKYVPRDTPNKPITEKKEIERFKKMSYIHLAVWTFIMILCLTFGFKLILLSSCLGFLLQLTFIIPLGCKIYSKLDGSTLISLK